VSHLETLLLLPLLLLLLPMLLLLPAAKLVAVIHQLVPKNDERNLKKLTCSPNDG
jgi:hypothetical protein